MLHVCFICVGLHNQYKVTKTHSVIIWGSICVIRCLCVSLVQCGVQRPVTYNVITLYRKTDMYSVYMVPGRGEGLATHA